MFLFLGLILNSTSSNLLKAWTPAPYVYMYWTCFFLALQCVLRHMRCFFVFVFFFVCQYSDLAEADRASVLENFRQATTRWNQKVSAESGAVGKDEQKSHMIVVTDTCLPLISSGEAPIAAHVLINYELPTKKVEILFFLYDLYVLYCLCSCLLVCFTLLHPIFYCCRADFFN